MVAHGTIDRYGARKSDSRHVNCFWLQGPGRYPEAATTAYGAERFLRIASTSVDMPGFPDSPAITGWF